MSNVTKGNVVKFVDTDGHLNGGTVVEFIRQANEDCCLINTLDGKRIIKKKADVIPIRRQQRGKQSLDFFKELKSALDKANDSVSPQITDVNIDFSRPKTEVKSTVSGNSAKQVTDNPVKSDRQIIQTIKEESSANKVTDKSEDSLTIADLRIENKDLKSQVYSDARYIESLEKEIESLKEKNDKLSNSISVKSDVVSSNVQHEMLIMSVKGLGDALIASNVNKDGDTILELVKLINNLNNIPNS